MNRRQLAYDTILILCGGALIGALLFIAWTVGATVVDATS